VAQLAFTGTLAQAGCTAGVPAAGMNAIYPATVSFTGTIAYAEVIGAEEIHVGVNAVDYSGYPDCRPEFLAAFEKLARVATKAGVGGRPLRIVAPLLRRKGFDEAGIPDPTPYVRATKRRR